MTSFIIWPFLFEHISPVGPVTCIVNGESYETVLRHLIILALQQCVCVGSLIFMQDDTPPHIENPVNQLLNIHFGNDRIMSRHFPTAWRQDHLILILGISGCGVFCKILYSVVRLPT